MYGFEVGERVYVTEFMGQPVTQPVSGIIVKFEEKAEPRNHRYQGNPFAHWVIVRIDVYKPSKDFFVRIGEEWPAQVSELAKVKEKETNEAV